MLILGVYFAGSYYSHLTFCILKVYLEPMMSFLLNCVRNESLFLVENVLDFSLEPNIISCYEP
jgi:hypothetical protein